MIKTSFFVCFQEMEWNTKDLHTSHVVRVSMGKEGYVYLGDEVQWIDSLDHSHKPSRNTTVYGDTAALQDGHQYSYFL